MAVTLEWSATLVRHHGLPPSQLRVSADMMRARYERFDSFDRSQLRCKVTDFYGFKILFM